MLGDVLTREMLEVFAREAKELCAAMTLTILELERADTAELGTKRETLDRGLHTLKGSAGTVGLDDLEALAHAMEDAIAPFVQSQAPLTAAVADTVLAGLDTFLLVLVAKAEGRTPDLDRLAETMTLFGAPAPSVAPARQEPVRPGPAPASTSVDESWRVHPKDITVLLRQLEELRGVQLRLEERGRRDLQADGPGETGAFAPRGPSTQSAGWARAEAERIASVIEALDETVKEIATQPVWVIVAPLQRAIRDLCRETGKAAKLSVTGEDIALDRRTLRVLDHVLVHLLRNAVDHGLEMPEVREAASKHREGALVVRVEQHGNVVFVEVSDDGHGLNHQAISEVAVARGLLTPDDVRSMERSALHQLIFQSGFSTKREVTTTSGRGVGLDLVREQVQSLDGHIDVNSTPGQGTRFTLAIPIEFGASPIVVVRVYDQSYGIPLSSVEAINSANRVQCKLDGRQGIVQFKGQSLLLHDLGALMELREPVTPSLRQRIVFVQAAGQRQALAVDELVGHLDLAVRALPQDFRSIAAYAGIAALPHGELMAILRPEWLVSARYATSGRVAGVRRALVVDNSLTARAIHRSILEAGGLVVHTANDGQHALDQLGASTYDIVVADVAMSPIDGFELTAQIRARPETKALAVILVSAKDDDVNRQRGLAAGADVFMSKKECSSGRLLAQVDRVILRRKGAA